MTSDMSKLTTDSAGTSICSRSAGAKVPFGEITRRRTVASSMPGVTIDSTRAPLPGITPGT